MEWINVADKPKIKGWYLLKCPDSLPTAVGRSWFDGKNWVWSDTAKQYLQHLSPLFWLDESSKELTPVQGSAEEIESIIRKHTDSNILPTAAWLHDAMREYASSLQPKEVQGE